MTEEYECPLCGEFLELNKEGVMRDVKNPEHFIYSYICEDCDQAFGIDDKDNKIKLLPYNSDMKLIENKCSVCGGIENYNEKGVFLLNPETANYKFYCFDCAIPFLQSFMNKRGEKKEKVTRKNIFQISEFYDMLKNQEMMELMQKEPERFTKLKNNFDKEIKNLEKKQ